MVENTKETGPLRTEQDGATLIVTIDGGPHQVFGEAVARALEQLVAQVDADPAIRAVVFRSPHPARFISHADVPWLQQGGLRALERIKAGDKAPPADPDAFGLDRLHGLTLKMNSANAVFVAALEGPALGLGAEFSWACDLRVIADDAFIGQPEIVLGIMPGGGGTQRLARLIGPHAALEAILQGRPLSPQEALSLRAVDAVCARGDVLTNAIALAQGLATRHKASIGAIKRAVYLGSSLPLPDGLKLETNEFLRLDMSPEGQARMIAYDEETRDVGELPLYIEGRYKTALRSGSSLSG